MPRKKFDVEARVSVKDDASKNVKKVERSFGRMARSVKAAGLSIVAALASVVGAIKLLEAAGERLGQKRALERTLEAQGLSIDEFVGKLKGLANNQIATSDIILASNRALALGIAADDLPGLLEAATKASVSLGISATQAFNDITTGVGRASPLILDNLGIVVDAVKIYKDFADALGVSTEELTKQQKTAALSAAVMENAAKGAADFADAQSGVTVAIAKSKTALKEWFQQAANNIAQSALLATAIDDTAEAVSDFTTGVGLIVDALKTLQGEEDKTEDGFSGLSLILDTLTANLTFAARAVTALGATEKLLNASAAEAIENAKKLTARRKELADGTLEVALETERLADIQARAAERTKRIESGLLAEATALDKLRTAMGEVTQAELQKELDGIVSSLEAARIETGGNTAAFLEMEAKVLPTIDRMETRIKGMSDGLGDIGEAAAEAGDKFGDLGESIDDVGDSADDAGSSVEELGGSLNSAAEATDRAAEATSRAVAALSREESQANRTSSAIRTLTAVEQQLELARARNELRQLQRDRGSVAARRDGDSSIATGGLSPFGTGGGTTRDADGNLRFS